MLTEREVSASIGGTAYTSSGDKIGTVEHYFVDDRTGEPSWVAVTTGLFGTRHSIVPATEATFADGGLRLPVTVDAVKSAPAPEGEHLSPDDEARLRRHYGLEAGPSGTPVWEPTGEGLRPPGAAGERTDAIAPDTAASDAPLPPPPASYGTDAPAVAGGMVRSEERLVVETERVAATRMRLVKYVVTEEVQVTVPIRREEIRVEEVPLDVDDDGSIGGESLVATGDGDARNGRSTGAGGEVAGGLPEEIILHSERPVFSVEVVPRERVRLRTELVHGQETVTGQVQREEIVVDETPSSGLARG